MSLGNALKEARLSKNYTQEKIAQKLYVTRQTVSRWEQDKTLPNIHVLKELSQLYDMSIDELAFEKNSKNETKEGMPLNTERKKINYFALFGVIFFNIILFSGIAIAAISLLFSLWIIVISFVISPFILTVLNITGLQDFSLFQSAASVLLLVVGVFLYPISKKITIYSIDFFTKYVKFNQKTIYY